jgi:pimeloyl-ACP methyl ester carboxylesterase
MWWILVGLGPLVALVGLSYLVEAMRTAPVAPAEPAWAPGVPARFVDAGGVRLRYVSVGSGPDLVLLHTLRTQLDMFQKVVPLLARHFRVYALDLPGHGFSDIADARYSADFFVTTVAAALDGLGVRDAVVAGESIGGSIALQLGARHHPRVARVVAINPYDYAGGTGIRRSSALANLIFGLGGVPVLGGTINRLRSYPVVRGVLQGGLRRPDTLPASLAREMYQVGNRPGYSRAFGSLVANWRSWEDARADYGRIAVPALLVYGSHDWSRDEERQADARDVPGAELRIVPEAGHFLSLDAPDALAGLILDWVRQPVTRPRT